VLQRQQSLRQPLDRAQVCASIVVLQTWSNERFLTPSGETSMSLVDVSCAPPSARTAVGSYRHGTAGNYRTLAEGWDAKTYARIAHSSWFHYGLGRWFRSRRS
jgi:hypothetical protein